jgi:hypothetical protein
MESGKKRGRGRPKGSTNKPKDDLPMSNLTYGAGNTGSAQKTSFSKPVKDRIYTQLSHTSLGNTELYNLYGVVIDASSPHPKKNFHR